MSNILSKEQENAIMLHGFVWDANELMKVIGKQDISFYFDKDAKLIRETFLNIPEPYCQPYKVAVCFAEDLLFSMYQLGRMHGVRQEREARKKRSKGDS